MEGGDKHKVFYSRGKSSGDVIQGQRSGPAVQHAPKRSGMELGEVRKWAEGRKLLGVMGGGGFVCESLQKALVTGKERATQQHMTFPVDVCRTTLVERSNSNVTCEKRPVN